jgi:hypothetical protein
MKKKVHLHRVAEARRAVIAKHRIPHTEKTQGTAVIRGSLVSAPALPDSSHKPKAIRRPYQQNTQVRSYAWNYALKTFAMKQWP